MIHLYMHVPNNCRSTNKPNCKRVKSKVMKGKMAIDKFDFIKYFRTYTEVN